MAAASIAGMAFGRSGVALTHSFGHSVGSIFNMIKADSREESLKILRLGCRFLTRSCNWDSR
ncbi:MAG: hypothetical protein JW943_02830 [Deltaproteobacteria bacterium]|nr:hypothetical protein [Deltaproteobacteria bacterium]